MSTYALITGASSGIGEEFAHKYAKDGYHLVLVARSTEKLVALGKLLENNYGITTYSLSMDLTEEYSAQKIFAELNALGVELDVLINNAGFATNGRLTDTSLEMQHEQIMLNSVSLMDLCYLFLQQKMTAGKQAGTIINIASTAAFHPIPFMAIYAATKSFVLSFTEGLHKEYSPLGFKIIAVCPGATDTNFFKNGGVSFGAMRTPADVVKTVHKGLKKQKAAVVDGSQNIFSSVILPKILSRKSMLALVSKIMQTRIKSA
ncbi:SDR family oxidoreductase [Niallia circulans]|uniref:SDR family oxidoreductase n=1 Tax=Niallia circulans TaxID=1397 RepID=A0A553ST57_NIACI|nr:SDR family oxidoreductase [Niallia circulans]TRZ40193.1 SDR family oxidoreductase [Niallia circulans]